MNTWSNKNKYAVAERMRTERGGRRKSVKERQNEGINRKREKRDRVTGKQFRSEGISLALNPDIVQLLNIGMRVFLSLLCDQWKMLLMRECLRFLLGRSYLCQARLFCCIKVEVGKGHKDLVVYWCPDNQGTLIYLKSSITGISISYCCSNKLPQMQWLKSPQIYYLIVLNVRRLIVSLSS